MITVLDIPVIWKVVCLTAFGAVWAWLFFRLWRDQRWQRELRRLRPHGNGDAVRQRQEELRRWANKSEG